MSEENFILLEECNIDVKKLMGMGIRGNISKRLNKTLLFSKVQMRNAS
jgi:hypothetical protein